MKSEERRGKSGSGSYAADWSLHSFLFTLHFFRVASCLAIRRQTVRCQKSDSIWREAPESDRAGDQRPTESDSLKSLSLTSRDATGKSSEERRAQSEEWFQRQSRL